MDLLLECESGSSSAITASFSLPQQRNFGNIVGVLDQNVLVKLSSA
jgi:hypothetical protein